VLGARPSPPPASPRGASSGRRSPPVQAQPPSERHLSPRTPRPVALRARPSPLRPASPSAASSGLRSPPVHVQPPSERPLHAPAHHPHPQLLPQAAHAVPSDGHPHPHLCPALPPVWCACQLAGCAAGGQVPSARKTRSAADLLLLPGRGLKVSSSRQEAAGTDGEQKSEADLGCSWRN